MYTFILLGLVFNNVFDENRGVLCALWMPFTLPKVPPYFEFNFIKFLLSHCLQELLLQLLLLVNIVATIGWIHGTLKKPDKFQISLLLSWVRHIQFNSNPRINNTKHATCWKCGNNILSTSCWPKFKYNYYWHWWAWV